MLLFLFYELKISKLLYWLLQIIYVGIYFLRNKNGIGDIYAFTSITQEII